MQIKGTKIFLIPDPSSELLKSAALAGAIKTTPAAANSVNLEALSSLQLIRRIFSNFLKVHQYPAFIDVDHLEYTEAHWLQQGELKRKRGNTSHDAAGPSKRVNTGGIEVRAEQDVSMEDTSESIPPGDKIIWAIPPSQNVVSWGEEGHLPDGDGLFIRFIDEVQNGNGEKIIVEVLVRYFLGCLGNNADAVHKSINKIRSDNTIIMQSRVGRELAHLAKCVDIGIQCQARIFPIISGEQYVGCTILGAGFQIRNYDSVWCPVSMISLRDKVANAGSHRSSLTAIADIVDPNRDNSLGARVESALDMTTLRRALLESETSAEERNRIVTQARNLRFRSKSLNVSADNISRILHHIAHPELEIDTTIPLHYSKLFEQNRTHVLWSSFGELAPVLNFPGGPQVNLESSKDLPKHVGVRMLPLKDSLVDLEMILSTKKFSNCTLNRRSGVFKDRIYTGLDANKIMSELSSAAGVALDKQNRGKGKSAEDVPSNIFEDGF